VNARATRGAPSSPLPVDPLWYKDAIVYEVHVRTFRDSSGDGVGDFRGLTEKLDHIAELGATAVWVQPFYPSPRRDGGYDIADYRGVDPEYGTLADFRRFVTEAHRRGLRVITELVCNHTSDQHPWFQRARRAKPGTVARRRYVWSDTPDRYLDARIIFTDTEPSNWTWDPEAGAWYWHRFFHHQPDLNFEEPSVHRAFLDIVDFWLGMGVDGLRLDAIPYLYEREGTNCENLPETHAFLKALRAHVDEKYPGRLLLAEANQWPEQAVAYFGEGRGDECHMCFHFPVMPRLYMALRREDRHAIVDILEQTPPIPETAQWGMFLRNHDELTLEMVTDEERDYMYRVYAEDPQMRLNLGIRRRLTPLMGRDRRRLELLHGLLFSMPGTPFLYYGDEIGMGDNVFLGDRDGVRTPMQWSADRNGGFSDAEPERLTLPLVTDPAYHYLSVNVASQRNDPYSWLSWMRRIIDLRKRHPVFGRGSLEMLAPENRHVLAYLRQDDAQTILVVANLSRFTQPVRVDLPDHAGWRPIELFGQNPFPAIGEDGSTPFTLGPHAFLWLALEQPESGVAVTQGARVPVMDLPERWPASREPGLASSLAHALTSHLAAQPWLRGSLRRRDPVAVRDVLPLDGKGRLALVLADVGMADGDDALVLLPLGIESAPASGSGAADRVVAISPDGSSALVEASEDADLGPAFLDVMCSRRGLAGWHGRIDPDDAESLRRVARLAQGATSTPARAGTRNISLTAGGAYVKLYRRVEPGDHVELEVGRQLRAQRTGRVLGLEVGLSWHHAGVSLLIGGLGPGVSVQDDGWSVALEAAAESLERVAAGLPAGMPERAVVGDWLEVARGFGERTADLHRSLAGTSDPAFRPERFGELYQRSLYQSIRERIHRAVEAADARAGQDPRRAEDAVRLRAMRADLDRALRELLVHPFTGRRIRCHGDLRLEHFLYAEGELAIVDFEGDPSRRMSERRIKRSPLRDVAALLASFTEAAGAALALARQRGVIRDGSGDAERWLHTWLAEVRAVVVEAHREGLAGHEPELLPTDPRDAATLLRAHRIDTICARIAEPLAGHPERLDLLVGELEALLADAPGGVSR
jgi:maltose alpha-D-glucosyltransferase / alpha-amylase